jgi:hypothetical protein
MLKARNQQPRSVDRPKLQAVIRNVTAAQIVKFDFVYGDPDLTVELVLPVAAFRNFCIENGCLVTAAEPGVGTSVLDLVASRVATFTPGAPS